MGGIVDSVFGGDDAADASREAADVQAASTREGIAFQREALDRQLGFATESRDLARNDLQPFREAGATDIGTLGSLVTDPQAQADFIQNNPFFDALTEKSTNTLLQNSAAKGKVGSGGTAEALQNSLLLLGNDLLNQDVNRRQNLATLGSNAAAGQATATQNTSAQVGNAIGNNARSISDLTVQGGNAQAAGIVGAQNAINEGRQSALNTAAQATVFLCDVRAKENITRIGYLDNGLPLYDFNYIGDDERRINVMAQDVEKVYPDAIIEMNGFKHVDMGVIHAS